MKLLRVLFICLLLSVISCLSQKSFLKAHLNQQRLKLINQKIQSNENILQNNYDNEPILVQVSNKYKSESIIEPVIDNRNNNNNNNNNNNFNETVLLEIESEVQLYSPSVRTRMCRNYQVKDISSSVSVRISQLIQTQIFAQLMKLVTDVMCPPVVEILMYIVMVAVVVLLMELFSDRITPLINIILPDTMEMMLPLLLQKALLDPLTHAIGMTLADALGQRLSLFLKPVIEEQLTTFTLFISDPDVSHAVPHLVSGRIAGPIAQNLRRELVRSLSHYITHKTTHGIIHEYYCQWCHWYNEYCSICFYYGDFKWLHQMWSMGGDDQSGNPFGNSVTSEFV